MSHMRKVPFIGSFIQSLDQLVAQHGFQEGTHKALKKTGTTLVLHGKTAEMEHILKTKPVVLVANHPFELEVLAIVAALPSRKDTFLIISSIFKNIVKSIDPHLIPVYIHHHTTRSKTSLLGWLMNKFHTFSIYSPEEEHEKNIKSINAASQKLHEGGLVIIFPNRGSDDGSWFKGVGHLIKGAQRDLHVAPLYIHGTSQHDLFRLIPFVGKLFPPLHIHFGPLIQLQDAQDPKLITRHLEGMYNNWSKTFIKPT